jgi:hypothetical protein
LFNSSPPTCIAKKNHIIQANKQVTSKLQALEANKQASKFSTLTLASKQAGTFLLACLLVSKSAVYPGRLKYITQKFFEYFENYPTIPIIFQL